MADDIVAVDWAQLQASEDLSGALWKAYGAGSLGLLVVRDVPRANELRERLLPLARRLGRLPPEALRALERPEASYCLGWSHGKESFKGVPDLAKGSFYANPFFEDPAEGDETVREKYPYAASRNCWPEDLPELQAAFKAMGELLRDVARLVLQQCDAMILAETGHSAQLAATTFERSKMHLGRLLHYFPMREERGSGGAAVTQPQGGVWCGWHNDNSTITGLVPDMWFDDATGAVVPRPEVGGGLHVQGRRGEVVRAPLPPGCLAFQVGEAAQILSGGALRATPHQVRGYVAEAGSPALSRESFACFFEPQWDAEIGPPSGVALDEIFRDEESELIPPLSKRFKPDPATGRVEFGKLLGDSFQEYYKHQG